MGSLHPMLRNLIGMTHKDKEKWDLRHQKDPGVLAPSFLVAQYALLGPCGKALDIACGNGRNSLFLAEKGFKVEAVDISSVALDRVAGLHPGITALCLDIDGWMIPKNKYDLIANIRFLDRRLFPMIVDGLKPGGVLIFESFAGGEGDLYCVKKNELLHAFFALHIVFYEEKKLEEGGRFDQAAGLVGIKPGDKPRQ